jgi:hypothetical protein
MTTRPVGAELFQAGGRADGWTVVVKQRTYSNFIGNRVGAAFLLCVTIS